jgi:hypothetical protein
MAISISIPRRALSGNASSFKSQKQQAANIVIPVEFIILFMGANRPLHSRRRRRRRHFSAFYLHFGNLLGRAIRMSLDLRESCCGN